MKYLLILIFSLSAYFFLRSLSFLITCIDLYNYRDNMCIERIVKQQKACDLLNSVYQTFLMMVSVYLAIECIQRFFNMNLTIIFNLTSFIAISICYITYFILRFKMELKYELCNFYNHMIDYRSKQKVVTQDNDDEVSFIRSYRKVMKHKRDMNILYLISLATLLYYFAHNNSGIFD